MGTKIVAESPDKGSGVFDGKMVYRGSMKSSLGSMATRDEFLKLTWNDIINSPMQEHWIDNSIRASERQPNAPFADAGPILKRLLALGVTRHELSLLNRAAAYEGVFGTLYALSDPGIDNKEIEMLHESLLGADPSGKEGRPGSAPQKNA